VTYEADGFYLMYLGWGGLRLEGFSLEEGGGDGVGTGINERRVGNRCEV